MPVRWVSRDTGWPRRGRAARRAGIRGEAGCTVAATAAACRRNTPESTLLDASAGCRPKIHLGGPELPIPPAQAVASGRYTHVPILMGDNHDEGRDVR